MSAVEVDAGVWLGLHRVHRVVQHEEAFLGRGIWIRFRRLAPFKVAVEVTVPGNDAQAVRLQDDDHLLIADSGRKAVDPGHIFLDRGGPAGRELRAVAERQIVSDQDRNRALARGALDGVLHRLLHALRVADCKPDRLGRVDHHPDEIGAGLVAAGGKLGDLLDRALISLGDVKIGDPEKSTKNYQTSGLAVMVHFLPL